MRVQVVSFHCVLKNSLGQIISSSFNHDVVTTPASTADEGQALPGFIEGLQGLREGERKQISVSADRAYGFYDPALLVRVPRSALSGGKKMKVGDEVKGFRAKGDSMRVYRVVSADQSFVFLEGNHPLAGQDLVFDVEVTSFREETDPETKMNFLC